MIISSSVVQRLSRLLLPGVNLSVDRRFRRGGAATGKSAGDRGGKWHGDAAGHLWQRAGSHRIIAVPAGDAGVFRHVDAAA